MSGSGGAGVENSLKAVRPGARIDRPSPTTHPEGQRGGHETSPSTLCAPSPSRSIAGSVKGPGGARRSARPARHRAHPPRRAAHTVGTRYRCRSAEWTCPIDCDRHGDGGEEDAGPINIPVNSEGASRPTRTGLRRRRAGARPASITSKSLSQTDSAGFAPTGPGRPRPPPSPRRARFSRSGCGAQFIARACGRRRRRPRCGDVAQAAGCRSRPGAHMREAEKRNVEDGAALASIGGGSAGSSR